MNHIKPTFIGVNKSFFQASFRKGFSAPDIPVVTVTVGSKKLNFVVDTGSDNNVINSAILSRVEHRKVKGELSHITGIGGTKEVETCTITFECGGDKYTSDFLAHDLTEAFDVIFDNHGVRLHGMLGSNFLKDNKVVLDFENFSLYSK